MCPQSCAAVARRGLFVCPRSRSTWPFVSGFFHVASCVQDSPAWRSASADCSFLWLNHTPPCGRAVCLRQCSFSLLVPLCQVAFLAVVNSVPQDSHLRVFVRWTSSCLGCRPGGVGIGWGCFFDVLSRFPFKCVKQLCCL